MAQGIGVEADATGTSISVSRHPASQSGTGSLRYHTTKLGSLILVFLVSDSPDAGQPANSEFKKIVRGEN
jgi:hypothetical protein